MGQEEGAWHATPKLISVPFPIFHKIPIQGPRSGMAQGGGVPRTLSLLEKLG